MTRATTDAAGLDPSEREMVQQCCERLQLEPVSDLEKISIGKSGALVTRMILGDRQIVLKITTETDRLARAASELRMISEHPDALADVMPRFVAGHRDQNMVCLVTEEHQALPHPTQLSPAEWSAMATALGTLHSVALPPWPDLVTRPEPDTQTVSTAADLWTQLGAADDARRATDLLVRDATAAPAAYEVPPGLVHGDCHTENMVRDELGRFRWIDWQEAQLGNGLGDLAFLWQRAEFAGANPPRETMIKSYFQARQLEIGTHHRRALDLAELRLLFISWPPFLPYGTPERQHMMKDRLPQLLDSLEAC